jgi:imidazolonepropionase-like amidohydrolase
MINSHWSSRPVANRIPRLPERPRKLFPEIFLIPTMNQIVKTSFALAIAFYSVSVSADEIPAPPQTRPILLSGGTIHPVSGNAIENGEILFENGKITAIGSSVQKPENCLTIDVAGKHVYPGMLEAHSNMGLTEIAAVRATNDFRESGSINPNVKALVSVYPDNVIIPVTRANGVLFALTAPEGGLVSGKSAVIQLDGWTYEDMSVKPEVAMHINWPSQYLSPRRTARMSEKEVEEAKKEQAELLLKIRDLFDQARVYRDARRTSDSTQKYDARLEAMMDVVDGKLPMMIRADRATDIQSAVSFAAEQKLKIIILGGYDAEQCAELLKKHDVPVVISAVYRNPQRRDDSYDASYTLPERLRKADVKYCICGTDRSETWNARILPYHAATAVGFGLPADEAIKAITLYPAQILGVDDRIGSLEVGKDASLIITDGSPLETTTDVLSAYIQGRKVDLSNRHLRLYKKYEQKYQQLKAGQK